MRSNFPWLELVEELKSELIEESNKVVGEVARGKTESPALAGLIFEYEARGMIKVLQLVERYENRRFYDGLQVVADHLTTRIDPEWVENRRRRYAEKPCRLSFERQNENPEHGRRED